MPVTFDFASATVSGANSSLTLAMTIGTGAKILLAFMGNDNTRSISAIAWAGTPLTRLAGVVNGSGIVGEVWALTAPAAGSNNLSCNWTGAGSLGMIGMSYKNVKASGATGTAINTTAGSAATAIFSISSTSTDIVVGFFSQNTGANTMAVNTGTLRKSCIASATTLQMIVADVTGAATVSFSATSTGASTWNMLGVPLIFSAVAASGPFIGSSSLLGVGY